MSPDQSKGGKWKRRRFFAFEHGKYATTIVYPSRRARILQWVLLVVLAIAGLYFLIWHKDPWPGNHEAIGLGDAHLAHDAIGVVLLAAAGFLWYTRVRKASSS